VVVSTTWLVIGLSLASALAFAASSSLKHISAGAVPDAQDWHPGKLRAFVAATLQHRLWIAGIGCDVVAVALQIVALHLGNLSLVQPLLICGLIFALLLRRMHDRRQVSGRQLWWAVVLSVGLAGFTLLAAGGGSGGHVDRAPAVIAGMTGALVALACVLTGRRLSPGGNKAALLGIAVGLIYAGTAALLKAATTIAVQDPARLFISWQLYLTIVLGITGLLLNQLAFQAGPLAASLPATGTETFNVSVRLWTCRPTTLRLYGQPSTST
jgi:drug/metabolite transporter (DMT)-like permease